MVESVQLTWDGVNDSVDHNLQPTQGTDALEAAQSSKDTQDSEDTRTTEKCQT